MRSRAHLKSHPLHPILVVFPIAFFTGAFVFDALWWFTDNATFGNTAYYLVFAGIVGALLAAVPGVIDYLFTVPPRSSARKRATKHGLLNLFNLAVFAAVLIYRQDDSGNRLIVLVAEGLGLIVMFVAGWMGGTLVHRNQIGVDHRYAHAGKWQEAYLKHEAGSVEVGTVDEIKENGMKLLHIGNKRIVLGRTENGYVAFDDRCTHRGGSLAGGVLMCGRVHCPWHGSQFDVQTGAVKAGPATEGIGTYPVEERSGKLFLLL